jgi:tetratricopeptide (TPR) repeat protein
MPNTRLTYAATFVALSLCGVAQWNVRERAMQHRQATDVYEHVYALPPGSILKVLALGQREALADLLWARGLVYLGEEAARNLDSQYLLRYGRAVASLDPYFARAYSVFAISANNAPGLTADETTQRIRDALRFLDDGVRALPDDGQLAWDTGATYAYTLAPRLKDIAEYREAKRRGIEHMEAATLRGAGPPWAGMANAATLVRLGQTEQAIAHLQELYAVSSDPDVRAEIESELSKLRSDAFMQGLRAVTSELTRAHERDFPYVSETLYLLLGSRPPFDRSAFLANRFDPAPPRAQNDSSVPPM